MSRVLLRRRDRNARMTGVAFKFPGRQESPMRRQDELPAINARRRPRSFASSTAGRPSALRICTEHKINVVVKPSLLSVVRKTVR